MSERVEDYDYQVPEASIAQVPPDRRSDARLLFVERHVGIRGEGRIPDLCGPDRGDPTLGDPTLGDGAASDDPKALGLRAGDLLVVNETAVSPVRLVGEREQTGGRVSVLLLSWDDGRAQALLGTRGTLVPGEILRVADDRWRLVGPCDEGRATLEVVEGRTFPVLLDAVGRMPLPPYIRRDSSADPRDALDRERYQTTFARADSGPPAVAAPTAGLHLTPELLATLQEQGVEVARLSLAVGIGTFRPMRGETLGEHVMHAERFAVPEAVAAAFAATRARGARVVAVGTTVVRALESAVEPDGRRLRSGPGTTDLFIRPGHEFRAVDALLTNFHQPRSTLLVLVSAFAGRPTILATYAEAIARGFRLFSYGDAMLLS